MKKGKVLEKTITVNGKKVTHTYIFDRIKKGNLNPFLEAAHWVRKVMNGWGVGLARNIGTTTQKDARPGTSFTRP